MESSRPAISVIVPVYNACATLDETLESLVAQTMRQWEAICVDDCSTDDSWAKLRAWAARDPRIRVVRQAVNGGVARARNRGLDEARGDYFHLLDSDDVVLPEAYGALLTTARHTGATAVAGSYAFCSPTGEPLYVCRYGPREFGLRELWGEVHLWTAQHIVHRERTAHVRFDEKQMDYEDWDFWFRLGEAGVRWTRILPTVAQYRVHPNSRSKRCLRVLTAAQELAHRWWTRLHARPAGAQPVFDLGAKQYDEAMRLLAMGYATRAAMIGGADSLEEVADAYARARGSKQFTPYEIAFRAHFEVMVGLGKPGNCVLRAEGGPVLDSLRAWWKVCERRGWLPPGGSEIASEMLLECSLTPDAVAEHIARCARDAGVPGVEVIGFGMNGSLLAAELAARGVPARVRDDRFPCGSADNATIPDGVEIATPAAPLRDGWTVVVTPVRPGTLLARFPNATTWRDATVAVRAQRPLSLAPAQAVRLSA